MCGNKGNIGSDKTKINCQCDGNCDCGKILPNGDISCDNCGWKAPEEYNAITGNHVCPSCRTESSFNSNNNNLNNKTMNNENFSKGLVGFATANPGFLNWSDNAIGKPNGSNESGYAKLPSLSSQNMVGYAMGAQGFMLDPFGRGGGESRFGEGLSEEDKKWAMAFYQNTAGIDAAEGVNNEESGLTFGQFSEIFHSLDPTAIVQRAIWSGKYCKSLGYMKTEDKNAFKRCVAATKINFVLAKKGKWKYPASPMGIEESISPEQLAAESAKELASMPPAQKEAVYNNEAIDAGAVGREVTPAKSNMMMYVIIGVVVLAIIIAIIIMMRKRATPAA